jgi:hypothetical protein
VVLIACATRADAVGWDSDDFLIGGGPSFTNKIGVFDHDLTFKGLLDSSYLGVGGLALDANGNLVAASFALNEVRVYSPNGNRIGGFVKQDGSLAASGDLRVTSGGNYLIGQGDQLGAVGAREFKPDGTFVRQYGDGNMARLAIVHDDKLWSGRFDAPTIRVFNLATGIEVTPFTVTGLSAVDAISFDATTNTVLFGHPVLGRVLETNLNGGVIRTFQGPSQASIIGITRGPNGDVFGTTGSSIWQWHGDGAFVGSVSATGTIGGASGIVWAGAVPEPTLGAAMAIATAILLGRRFRRGRFLQR